MKNTKNKAAATLAKEKTTQNNNTAFKKSDTAEMALKKIHSPLRLRNWFVNIFAFLVLTAALVFVVCFFMVEQFNFKTLFLDMMDKLGITNLWNTFYNWLKKLIVV